MTTVETHTTLRSLVFDSADDAALTEQMTSNLPRRGLADGTRGARLPRAALKLVENRILATALSLLDDDPGPLFAKGLGTLQEVMGAARATRADPGRRVVATIQDPYRIPVRRSAYVALLVENQESARVDFDFDVVFAMGHTSISLRHGAVDFIECDAGELTVSLSLSGAAPPLLSRKADFPVHWEVRPPIRVPIPEPGPEERVRSRPRRRPYGT
ncbi:hypothetical protein [Rhodococcus sp. R1101]|uniref:hypothetical protein n=1 Tax=Rhodococcus sp. R1101 TaxID=1170698 RepID=UPI0002D606B4|nr:hypothetical protein [Rhodococcus sp. R1101]